MNATRPNYYPAYSRAERAADLTLHITSIVLGVIGSVALIQLAAQGTSPYAYSAVMIYCAAMLTSVTASLLYHFTPYEPWRPWFRRADHAAIFLKIAGTYTPLVALIGGGFSVTILGLVWIIALGGIIWKLFFWSTPNWKSTLLYLTLGWLSLALAWPFAKSMPIASTLLVALGGLTYSAGVIFYRWDSLKFSVAIWHGFVLMATACFFAAIAVALSHNL